MRHRESLGSLRREVVLVEVHFQAEIVHLCMAVAQLRAAQHGESDPVAGQHRQERGQYVARKREQSVELTPMQVERADVWSVMAVPLIPIIGVIWEEYQPHRVRLRLRRAQ